MAKKFFYVCAGLFLLVASYHFGASSAGAQAGAANGMFAYTSYGPLVVHPNGDVYIYTGGAWTLRSNVFGGSPGGRTVVEVDGSAVLTSSGEILWAWESNVGSGPWFNAGVPPGAPTYVQRESWGAVKQRYR